MQTLVTYLEATKVKVGQRAREIISGMIYLIVMVMISYGNMADPNSIEHAGEADRVEIAWLSSGIVKEGWHVPKFMIDKCVGLSSRQSDKVS